MIDNLKITVLSENNTKKDTFLTEHGLSLLIEVAGKKILFDTGASDCFIKNAKQLDINLNSIDCIVLSHGHYDHVGGLHHLRNKKVFVHPHIFNQKYKLENSKYKAIGFEFSKSYYENNNNLDFIEISENTNIDPEIKLIVNFKKTKNDRFFIRNKNIYVQDSFTDEVAITIKTTQGLVVITGCSHSGIINILEEAINVNEESNIYALLGGLHLSSLDELKTKEIANKINRYNIKNIGINHCTGNKLVKYLRDEKIIQFNCGDLYEI